MGRRNETITDIPRSKEAKENDTITFIPRSKEAKKRHLQALVFRLLQERWMKVTKARATLERIGIRELIESI